METLVPSGRPLSVFAQEATLELREAAPLGRLHFCGDVVFEARAGKHSIWIVAVLAGVDLVALRAGYTTEPLGNIEHSTADGTTTFAFTSSLGPMRVKVSFPAHERAIVRCSTSLIPPQDRTLAHYPRDLYPLGGTGELHTSQRGLRTGIAYASAHEPVPHTLFYLQDFSTLNDFFTATKTTPADCVGGQWPELGYAPPAGDTCVLPAARETTISDAYLYVVQGKPADDGAAAAQYLDALADVYALLDHPPVHDHDWPHRAADSLRHLSLSPACSYVRGGARYLMPYVGDEAKPPESMVQLTLAANTTEYARWSGEPSALAESLQDTVPAFFNPEVGTIVRWLPGEQFESSQAEDNMNHDAMDSWYLHHAVFNALRLAATGNAAARDAAQASLPYLIRVARRFDYRWPIFFHLRTLDVIRAESSPGKGGENDVAGFYSLVMLHAYELFKDEEFLSEAKEAARRLRGLGFALGYQLNTTGFAAEAAMRLFRMTGERVYLGIADACMASLFDNVWLWRGVYERACHYRTYFGLFPLHDAPYLAAYEELEAHAKFRDYLEIGGDAVRPSLRYLIAEYQKYSLDRTWFYYPDALPLGTVSEKPRNGRIERSLSIPLEDLQDGRVPSGQVGQEIYGAGLAMIMTTRHYTHVPEARCMVACQYTLYDAKIDTSGRTLRGRVGGDPRGTCELRIVPRDASMPKAHVTLSRQDGAARTALEGRLSPEGHAVFEVRGGDGVEIRFRKTRADASVEIGAMFADAG